MMGMFNVHYCLLRTKFCVLEKLNFDYISVCLISYIYVLLMFYVIFFVAMSRNEFLFIFVCLSSKTFIFAFRNRFDYSSNINLINQQLRTSRFFQHFDCVSSNIIITLNFSFICALYSCILG